MKKTIPFLCHSLFILLIMSGCHLSSMSTDMAEIFQYKETVVSDNSTVSNIVHELPHAEHLKSIELKTKAEPFGLILNYESEWSEDERIEATIYNSTLLFILIDNIDWITFHDATYEQTLFREDLETIFEVELKKVVSEEQLNTLLNGKLIEEIDNELLLNLK